MAQEENDSSTTPDRWHCLCDDMEIRHDDKVNLFGVPYSVYEWMIEEWKRQFDKNFGDNICPLGGHTTAVFNDSSFAVTNALRKTWAGDAR